MLKSNTNGSFNPNSCSKESHHNPCTLLANLPISPPITNPDKINTINIHIFFSLVASFVHSFHEV